MSSLFSTTSICTISGLSEFLTFTSKKKESPASFLKVTDLLSTLSFNQFVTTFLTSFSTISSNSFEISSFVFTDNFKLA
jgi:hypothetical protein